MVSLNKSTLALRTLGLATVPKSLSPRVIYNIIRLSNFEYRLIFKRVLRIFFIYRVAMQVC